MTRLTSSRLKEGFENSVDRSSTKGKVESLLNLSDDIIMELESESMYLNNPLYRKVKILQILARFEEFFKDLSLLLVIVYHLYILFTFDTDGSTEEITTYSKTESRLADLRRLAWIMFCISIFILAFTVIKRIIVIKNKFIENMHKKDSKKLSQGITNIKRSDNWQKARITWGVFTKVIRDLHIIYYTLYVVFAFLSPMVSPFFMLFHLLDVIIRSPLLRNILRAIYEPREQLILSLMLFFVCEYVFALIGFVWMAGQYPDFACSDSLLRCFLIHLD